MADSSQIGNAVLNLAINARDAMPDGGTLTIDCRNMTVDDDFAPAYGTDFRPGDYVVISVTDTGHGMAPDVVARAFDPFFTTKEQGVGTGLGLSMVFGTMKQSGGTARIYSEPGQGTTVQLYLPRTTIPVKSENGHAIDAVVPSRGNERVLVVEDNERIRDVSCTILADLGYRIEAVDSADEALARIASGSRFELVFSDAIPMLTHQSERLGPDNPEQFLDHILYAEMPVYRFGVHRYWTDPALDFQPPAGSEARLIFARGERWGLYDRFIKNTYEVLSYLNRVTATLPMTDHRFLTPDRMVERTRFGDDVEITVNYGAADYAAGDAVLPQFGFLVKSPSLIAFRARKYGRVDYEDPPLFVLRSLDGQPLAVSRQVAVYHGFGDRRLDFQGRVVEIRGSEQVLAAEVSRQIQ